MGEAENPVVAHSMRRNKSHGSHNMVPKAGKSPQSVLEGQRTWALTLVNDDRSRNRVDVCTSKTLRPSCKKQLLFFPTS